MLDNIGGKIKTLAVVVCIIGMIASVIGAFVIWGMHDSRYNPTIWLGFIVLLAGCLGSWIGSFFTYGFGQLIESNEEEVALLRRIDNQIKAAQNQNNAAQTTSGQRSGAEKQVKMLPKGWKCPDCGYDYNGADKTCCDICGARR